MNSEEEEKGRLQNENETLKNKFQITEELVDQKTLELKEVVIYILKNCAFSACSDKLLHRP